MMVREVTLMTLPPRVSEIVDKAVKQFKDEFPYEKVQTHRRWHGADLWMIFADKESAEVGDGELAIVTRRVTIGAYSDDPDILAFIPDILLTTRDARYVLPSEERGNKAEQRCLSIFELMQGLLTGEADSNSLQHQIVSCLEAAWKTTKCLNVSQATVLLP